jgi:hypothetical protein
MPLTCVYLRNRSVEYRTFALVDPRSLAPIVPGGYAADRANHAMERIP